MRWQEYQTAVALLYERIEGIGAVLRNVFLRDRVTGQRRQVDVLLELDARGHTVRILIDAKFRAQRLDVTDVEGVIALADAVGADKAVIVASNGWTKPAAMKARFCGLDLRMLTFDEAVELLEPAAWAGRRNNREPD